MLWLNHSEVNVLGQYTGHNPAVEVPHRSQSITSAENEPTCYFMHHQMTTILYFKLNYITVHVKIPVTSKTKVKMPVVKIESCKFCLN